MIWEKLEKFFQQTEANVKLDTYLAICEQRGEEPDPNRFPVEFTDFPETVQNTINIFNMLGDRIAADIGYLGKDYTNLPLLIKAAGIEEDDLEFCLEILSWLDSRAIKKSMDRMERERKKLERKHRG